MSTTLKQFLSDKPRLDAATKHLNVYPKLRRLVCEEMIKLSGSTSKVDLFDKVLGEITKTQNMHYLFGEKYVREQRLVPYFIYDHLENPIKTACEIFTGVQNQSKFEASLFYKRSHTICPNKKSAESNIHVQLSNLEDKNRVYVTDPTIEVCIVENISPSLMLDDDVKDRHKHSIPRNATFIKLNELSVLYLFHSYGDGVQKRFVLPIEKVKGFTFKPLHEGFIQLGLQIVPRELTGAEFDLNTHAERTSQKRYLGNPPMVYVFDQTWRGRMGKTTSMTEVAHV